jgi:DNA-directed RNA polymerase subunit RPC12/RpoP
MMTEQQWRQASCEECGTRARSPSEPVGERVFPNDRGELAYLCGECWYAVNRSPPEGATQ